MKWKLVACALVLACIILQAMPVRAASGTTEVSSTVPLVTYDISVSNIGYHRATISWKTNGNATSQVFYDNVSHGSIADYGRYTDVDTSLVSEHSIALTGLSSSTTYHYRVRSVAMVDSTEFIAISEDHTFTTLTPADDGGAPPTPPPKPPAPLPPIELAPTSPDSTATDTEGNELTGHTRFHNYYRGGRDCHC